MNALWFAFVVYILGMAVVLYFRPSFMFDGGAWKEFGLSSGSSTKHSNTTLFPFWMFVVLWSIVSYLAGTLVVVGVAATSGNSTLVNVIPEETLDTNNSADVAPVAADAPVAPVAPVAADAPKPVEADATKPAAPPELVFNEETPPDHNRRQPRRRRDKAARTPMTGYYVKGIVNGKETYVYYGSQSPFDKK